MQKCIQDKENESFFGNHDKVAELISSTNWLKLYGLKKLKLDFAHILSSIGFQNSDDYIHILKKPVSSRYSIGLFKKVAHKNGTFYNVIASKNCLVKIEENLKHAVEIYKRRLEWLTTSSRRTFGVIQEKRVCIIIDIEETSDTHFEFHVQVLKSLVKEQFKQIQKFNFLRATTDGIKWHPKCVPVNADTCSDAIEWLNDQIKQTEYNSTSLLQSVLDASTDSQIEAIYVYTDGSFCKSGLDILTEKVKDVPKPIHIVYSWKSDYIKLGLLKKFAESKCGRFHFYDFQENNNNNTSHSSENVRGVREDVMMVWEELDMARNTLFDVQSILSDLETTTITNNLRQEEQKYKLQSSKPSGKSSTEFSMSSKEWLKKNGLKKLNITLYSYLKDSAFHHCDGVLDYKHSQQGTNSTLINAKYCCKFAHLKWYDGSVKHVHVTESSFNRFKSRMMLMLDRYQQRLDWLQKGSRELFGTIIEDKVVILIDTSFSMDSRLLFVKEKLLKLFQEQLINKVEFNLIHFDSNVESWRDHLVTCNSENLDNAWHWVKALDANGSTNTLRAIHHAYSMRGVQALYLLTDGRPDQLPQKIFSHINKTIPIHSISFNCNDVEANEFLNQLSSMTGGRYHFFSEDITSDTSSPPPFESEDLFLLKNEIEKGVNDLQTMSKLQKECLELDRMNKERRLLRNAPQSTQKRIHIEHRPQLFSAHSYINNRASLLRISPPKEPKIQDVPSISPIRNTSSRKKKRSPKSEIKRWLNKNSIKAQKLTILDDVLAPTVINHNPKYVPALKKNVLAKVYDEMLPIVHTSLGKEGKYQLVNPNAVDLIWYEDKLNDCLRIIEMKLNKYVFENISEELRESLASELSSGLPPSYSDNKDAIDEDLRKQDLQTVINDKILLEKELEKGYIFLQQSKDLRQISVELANEKKRVKQDANNEKVTSKRIFQNENQLSTSKGRIRYHRVLARSDLDGFYYPAIVNKHVNDRYVNVCFDNGENQISSVRYVISVGGSTACPSLNVGDYVLVKCSAHSDDEHSYYYVPGIVQVTPLRMKSGNKCYTVIRYNGIKITSVRKDLVKITRSRFVFSTRFIQELHSSVPRNFQTEDSTSTVSSKRSSISSVPSRNSSIASPAREDLTKDKSIPVVVIDEVSPPNNQSSSVPDDLLNEQHDSSNEKGRECNEEEMLDDSSSGSSDDASIKEDKRSSSDIEEERIANSEEKDDDQYKEGGEHHKHIFDEWKVLFEEKHNAKMKELEEQKQLLLEMQARLQLTEEKQSEKERSLDEQRQRLQQQQQLFFEKQIQHQNDEQQTLKENYKDLTELQKEIFKRQQEQESQLMKHLLAKEETYNQQQAAHQIVLQMKDEETNTDDISSIPTFETLPPPPDHHPTMSSIEENVTPDLTSDNKNEDANIKVFLDPSNEAVLMAQGDSGILLSRHPPDEDPAVMIRKIPTVLQKNQEILACFKDDGWYYRATVKNVIDDSHYSVEDGLGDTEHVSRDDVLCDSDDADNIIQIGDCVVALHPRYQYAYAPGIVHDVEIDGALKIRFYDSQLAVIPRAETYLISVAKYEQDCNRIRQCEDALLGQAVVCRDNKTGVYQLASVRDRVAGSRNYLMEWADQKLDVQNYAYIFGAHTKRQKIIVNSYVLAITNFDLLSYLPGVVVGMDESNFKIQFCDSDSLVSVAATHCFWISPDYYRNAVKYWKQMNQKSAQ